MAIQITLLKESRKRRLRKQKLVAFMPKLRRKRNIYVDQRAPTTRPWRKKMTELRKSKTHSGRRLNGSAVDSPRITTHA